MNDRKTARVANVATPKWERQSEAYNLFSELAGHASVLSVAMLRPRGMDARNGPFLDPAALQAVEFEMSKLAIQVADVISAFLPCNWDKHWPPLIPATPRLTYAPVHPTAFGREQARAGNLFAERERNGAPAGSVSLGDCCRQGYVPCLPSVEMRG